MTGISIYAAYALFLRCAQRCLVVKFAFGNARRGPIQGISAVLADQHPLQQTGHDGTPHGELFVLLQLFLSQGKGGFRD